MSSTRHDRHMRSKIRSIGWRIAPVRGLHGWWTVRRWERAGRPIPPPSHYKRQVVAEYAHESGSAVFVETGTFLGDTVATLHPLFEWVYSIELDEALAARAQARFRRCGNVQIIHGDSATEIPRLLPKIAGRPCLFWLDGHFSGGFTALGEAETPIVHELEAVAPFPGAKAVLIDDAREFGPNVNYPALADVENLAKRFRFSFEVRDDIIRLTRP
jgi:hypothetical protein